MVTTNSSDVAMVTGGAGFIGSTLVDRLLAEGRRVVVIDNLSTGHLAHLDGARRHHAGDLEFHRLELVSDAIGEIVQRASPDVVFHCALPTAEQASSDPVRAARDVSVGTVNLLLALARADVRKIVVASDALALHGQVDRDDLPIVETMPIAPVSVHGAALAGIEPWLHATEVQHGLEWTVLAMGTAYGPRQAGEGAGGEVADMVAAMLRGVDVTIAGDGEQTRDFVYVDDVVDAFVRAAEPGVADDVLCNIGTGVETSVNVLYGAMAHAAGVTAPAEHAPPRAGELARSALAVDRARRELGWAPQVELADGTARVLDWFRAQRA